MARILIWYHSACCMVMWPAAWTLPSILRAAGDVKFVMVSSIIIMWVFRIGLAYVIGGLMQTDGTWCLGRLDRHDDRLVCKMRLQCMAIKERQMETRCSYLITQTTILEFTRSDLTKSKKSAKP